MINETLKSALLNILPASERNAFQTNLKEPVAAPAPALQRVSGLDGLKAVLSQTKRVQQFKYNKDSDALYVYYKSYIDRDNAVKNLTANPNTIGGLPFRAIGASTGLRIDTASKFSIVTAAEKTKSKLLSFTEWAQYIKETVTAKYAAVKGVKVTFKVASTTGLVYAYVTTVRQSGTALALSQRILRTEIPYTQVNSQGEYGNNLKFNYEEYKVNFASREKNAMLVALEKAVELKAQTPLPLPAGMANVQNDRTPANPLDVLQGLITSEELLHVKRVLDGERLPAAPAIVPYMVSGSMTEIKLYHQKDGKEVQLDIEAAIADLVAKDKNLRLWLVGEITYAEFGRQKIKTPSVILIRDANVVTEAAYIVIRDRSGFHVHNHITRKK